MFTALMEYLTGVTALTDEVPAASIQPVSMRKTVARPYIVVNRLARVDSQDLSGNTTYAEADSFEIDIVTSSALAGETIREIVRKNLDGYQQQNMGTTSPVYIGSTRQRNVYNYSESSQTADDDYDYHTVMTFDFGYTQADNDNNTGHPVNDWVARYEFVSAGTLLTDATGNYNLTNNGATWADDATRQGVASFDGSTSYMDLPSVPTGTDTGVASWSVWFNADSLVNRIFLGNKVGLTGSNKSLFYIVTSTSIKMRDETSAGVTFAVPAMSVGTWYNVITTRDSSNDVRLYLNGIESATGALSQSASFVFDRIAARNTGTLLFDGELDNITYYDRELSASEVSEIYTYELSNYT